LEQIILSKSKLKKEDILDAAMQCIARYGINKTTLDDIARLVGLNKATLYYYYDNKESIFIDALEREAGQLLTMVQESFKKNATAKDKIYTFLKIYHNYLRDRAEILEFNAQAMIESQVFIRKIHKRMREKNIDLMREIIQQGIDDGEFRRTNPSRVADIIRYIFDLRRLEFYIESMERGQHALDLNKLENDSKYILDIFLNGLIKHD
jgi:AcrR family transcriptional regulator